VDSIRDLVNVQELMTAVVQYVPRLLAGLGLLIAFWAVFRVVRHPLRAGLHRAGLHDKIIDLIVDRLLRYTVMLIGLVMALDQLGVNVGAALAGMGVAGIAVGFAAQDSVANVIAGILIFWDKPFVVGDWIKTEGEYGQVSNITMRTTRIRTPRNTYIVIPNKRIIDQVMENYSKHGKLRVDVPVGIAYKEDIPAAREALIAAVERIGAPIESEPAPQVVVSGLGDSSVNLEVRVWIEHADDQQGTIVTVLEAAKLGLDAAGIEIPFPHLQLFVDDVRERIWERAATLRGA